MEITFGKDLHDEMGNITQEGIFLFVDGKYILKVENLIELDELIKSLVRIKDEINERY